MGQTEYIIAIIVTIPLAFYLGKKIGKSYRNSAIFGIMTLGGWLLWTFAASIPIFIKQPQYSLIIVIFLISWLYFLSKMFRDFSLRSLYFSTIFERLFDHFIPFN